MGAPLDDESWPVEHFRHVFALQAGSTRCVEGPEVTGTVVAAGPSAEKMRSPRHFQTGQSPLGNDSVRHPAGTTRGSAVARPWFAWCLRPPGWLA